MSYKLFISHAGDNKKLAELFAEFLQLGMGIHKDEIYCTSMSGLLHTGKEFIPDIRENIKDCKAVVFLITPEYLKRKFCLAEMGAAWALEQNIYPLIVPPVDFASLEDTPLKGIQARRLTDKKNLAEIYGEWIRDNLASTMSTGDFYEQAERFVGRVKEMTHRLPFIQKDEQEYYTADIIEQRNQGQIPPTHRCYRISGKPEEIQDDRENISVWLLYFSNRFGELKVGDRVRFKITDVKLKHFDDIGDCYNLYISNLEKICPSGTP